ncbi:DUF5107 domain-containing protein [Flexivirga meconopsidis]|uniref:DUF5107 domain-containing protein n=1 Tax=Flexivirga meconopsidis TaxID=2977121 RepID=UPI00223EC189
MRTTRLAVRGARLGPPSTLPAYRPVRPAGTRSISADAPPLMRERIARGRLDSPLPYALFSDYDRGDHPLELTAIQLDNGLLRATVLPGLGGRVWSLRDLRADRELLFVPKRLRYANFGLTDAWFAGGIEWNLGSTGHTTLTTRPMHAAVVDGPHGQTLRMWEWERTRDLVLQLDLALMQDRLLVSTRVINPDPEPKPLYYWTNIAVPETSGTRVLTTASHAWRTDYAGSLDRVPVPHPDSPNVDVSYPATSGESADYFFEVADQQGRFVTSVEADGAGFAQTSTDALHGRKLFLWGHAPGGRRWQRWLVDDDAYAEIQAGVCITQLEHDELAGHETRSWTEAFGGVRLDPADARAAFPIAADAAAAAVRDDAPPDWLESWHDQWLRSYADQAPLQTLAQGSGWGRIELALREQDAPRGLVFPELDDDSRAAAALLRGEPVEAPLLPPVSARWTARLAQAPRGWWTSYALGVGAHLRGEFDSARAHYADSVAQLPSAVALRGLAILTEEPGAAVPLYRRARELDPTSRGLLTEQVRLLLDSGAAAAALQAIDEAAPALRRHGRTRLLRIEALHGLGRDDEAAALIADLEVEDLAEGDRVIGDLLSRIRPGMPLPPALDFRMTADRH